MILSVNNTEFRHFDAVNVQLSYDSIASAFSVDVYFDPANPVHRDIFRPASYARCELYDDIGRLLITGTILRTAFSSNTTGSFAKISGYSLTGVLEDCEIPLQCYPLQTNQLSLEEICVRICRPFGIEVVVDPSVAARAGQRITKSTASDSQSPKAYLSELAASRQIVLTHTPRGELLLTEVNTLQDPVYNFSGPSPGLSFSMDINGQGMHSDIGCVRQARKRDGGGVAGQSVIANPYVPVFRSSVKRQISGDHMADTDTTARNILSDELRSISLGIEMEGSYLNNTYVQPGQMIVVQNPELYLYQPTVFFIESVKYKQDRSETTSSLSCYLPEVYNSRTPKNIFL